MEAEWARRLIANPSLFNGTKFRFAGVEFNGETASINLGFTGYKEFIGSNTSADASAMRAEGERLHGDPAAFMVWFLTSFAGIAAALLLRPMSEFLAIYVMCFVAFNNSVGIYGLLLQCGCVSLHLLRDAIVLLCAGARIGCRRLHGIRRQLYGVYA